MIVLVITTVCDDSFGDYNGNCGLIPLAMIMWMEI